MPKKQITLSKRKTLKGLFYLKDYQQFLSKIKAIFQLIFLSFL